MWIRDHWQKLKQNAKGDQQGFQYQGRKNLEQKLTFQPIHSLHTESMNASHSTNLFTNSCDHIFTNGKAPLHSHINHNNPQFLYSL